MIPSQPGGPLAAILAISPALFGQGTYISPPHAVEVEGSSSSRLTFTTPTTRTQQTDSNLMGSSVVAIRSLAFRRSNSHSRVGATPRTADIRIDMGFGITVPTNRFDANYRAGSRRSVHPTKNVSLPDWTGPTSTPAPFDLVFPFATPFLYDDRESLVWDVLVENGTGGGDYYMDWMPTPPALTRGPKHEALGSGCPTSHGVFTHAAAFSATSSHIILDWEATAAPPNGTVMPALGLSDPNAQIGWCARLRSDAALWLPPVRADSTGFAADTLTVPWVGAFAGVTLYMQVAASDGSQPAGITLSNGVRVGTPFVNAGGTSSALRIVRLYDSASHGPAGSGPFTTAVPVQYGTN